MSQTADLERFIIAQDSTYARVRSELTNGRKVSHWMWFIFPQLAGLGRSLTAREFAIKDLNEARRYLAHPVLGPRLLECAGLVLGIAGRSAREIFDGDDVKLRSSATLFAQGSPAGSPFHRLIDRYFEGAADNRTLELLAEQAE